MKVLVAPDKFKGSLTAPEIVERLRPGLAIAGVESLGLPLADGGDGTVEAAVAAGFRACPVTVPDALGTRHDTQIADDGTTAVVEVANTCGLALLGARGPEELDAFAASSAGFGEAIAAAVALRPSRLVLGLGGSASTDGGLGMLRALGARFLDAGGGELAGRGADLAVVDRADLSGLPDLTRVEVLCATDVDSPLLGLRGAAHVFGAQKGADRDERLALDAGLARLVGVLDAATDGAASTWAALPGAGAAGGLGFACSLLGARQVSGADLLLDLLGFDEAVAQCDAVITGEGGLDAQTLTGKLPAVVARRSGGRPVAAVVGRSELPVEQTRDTFVCVAEVAGRTDVDTRHDPELTGRLLEEIGRELGASLPGWVAGRHTP